MINLYLWNTPCPGRERKIPAVELQGSRAERIRRFAWYRIAVPGVAA